MAKVTGGSKAAGRVKLGAVKKAAAKAQAKKAKVAPKKADAFGGTNKGQVAKPAAELPRSGWANVEEFKEAQRGARARMGAAGVANDRPTIRPLYGMAIPIPLPNLSDRGLREAADGILRDRRISLDEVNNLIAAANDNGGLSKTEKKDIKRLIDQLGDRFDMNALRKLQKFVSDAAPVDRPVIRPMYGLPIPVPLPVEITDLGLKNLLKNVLRDRTISSAEVQDLIAIAKDNGGIDRTERNDLERLYNDAEGSFAPEAHTALGRFLGFVPTVLPLYGLPVPVPLDVSMKDVKLKDALKPMLGDRKITRAEVEKLIDATKDGRGLSRTERADLERLLKEAGNYFNADAKDRLEDFLGHQPRIMPLYGLPFPFPGPQVSIMSAGGAMGPGGTLPPSMQNRTVTEAHAKAFVAAATNNGGLTSMEKSEMRALLSGGARFDAAAKKLIEDYLKTQP